MHWSSSTLLFLSYTTAIPSIWIYTPTPISGSPTFCQEGNIMWSSQAPWQPAQEYLSVLSLQQRSINILKIADDTTVAMRLPVEVKCVHNNLQLNAARTVELLIDFREHHSACQPATIYTSAVSKVGSLRFLETSITNSLKWDNITTILKKCSHQLRKLSISHPVLRIFYWAITERVLTSSITVCFPSAGPDCSSRSTRLRRSSAVMTSTPSPVAV